MMLFRSIRQIPVINLAAADGLYELPSALADGTVIAIITGFSQNQINYQSCLLLPSYAIRNLIYSF